MGKSLKDIVINSFRVVDAGDNPEAHIVLLKNKGGQSIEIEDLMKAVWTTAYINDLPDGSFLYISPGGKKDSDGKTVPRNLRHFPYKDSSGKVDAIHVRNALARIPQANVPQEAKNRATAHARRVLADINKEITNENLMKGVEYVMTIEEILAKMDDEDQNFLKTEFEARTNEITSLKADSEKKDAELEKQKTEIEKQKVETDKIKKELEEIKKTKKGSGSEEGGEEGDIFKDADPKVKEQFEKMQKRLDDSKKEAEVEKEKVANLQKEVEMERFTKEAEGMQSIAKETGKLAELLYTIKKSLPEEKYTELKEILDSANGVIKESKLLVSVGSGENGDGKDAESTLDKKAKALAKEKGITEAQAMDEVLQSEPELYEKYNKEKEGV